MMIRLLALAGTLTVVAGAAVAGDDCSGQMTLQQAIDLHEAGKADECPLSSYLVKSDIRECLTYYGQDECKGAAQKWLQSWGALQAPPLPEPEPQAIAPLPKPSFLGLHVPFTKSATDYLDSYADRLSPAIAGQ